MRCAGATPAPQPGYGDITVKRLAGLPAGTVPADAGQALVVRPAEPGPIRATLTAWERRATGWAAAFPAMEAVVGRAGFAAPGAKREGDGATPAGVYRLGPAFGYDP